MNLSLLLISGGTQETLKKFGKTGDKNKLTDGDYFIYSFSEKPKIGTTILAIKIFDRDGSQIIGYEVEGKSGMPSMKGAHSSGWKKFIVNRKENYLLPIDIVMKGEWEIILRIHKDGKEILTGAINFEI